jgi:acyl-CoA reductase-like NAD-dependent aldehyde dehydrogenase
VSETMRRLFHAGGFPEQLVQIVSGDAQELMAIVAAGADKLIFFGDPDYDARLAANCAAVGAEFHPVRPGKNALLILENAPLDRAVHAAMWAAFSGGGTLPGSLERIVIAKPLYDEFRMRLIESARAMNSHHAQLASIGETFEPPRFKLLLDDAIARGARVTWPAGEAAGRWITWKTAVIEALPDDALLSTERVEGPAVALYNADDVVAEGERLLKLAPAGMLSVLGKPSREQKARLEAAPVANVMFQDVAAHGYTGWTLGPELPRTWCSPLAMLRPRVISEGDPLAGRVGWFPYTDDKAYALLDAIEASYGVSAASRMKARLKLLLNGPRRKLLDGDNS